uniref:Cyanocobalamin reductase (cyanide-eliminating) n=1 Tax=Caenorhabditis japonica TaxID=281687 RepID=A0A8R1EMQ3_CAEJA
MALLILSTPNMFDVAFRKWVVQKTMEFGSFDKVSELVTSPIQNFLEDRLDVMSDKLRELEENFEILHDYSMTPQRRPKILMQTCGHVAGAAFYYQPRHFREENVDWPPPGKMGPNLSPSSSPNVKLKITGLPNRGGVDQVQDVRDVGEMSSDSSNSSDSSDDERDSKKTASSSKS